MITDKSRDDVENFRFHLTDYFVFGTMLFLSTSVGVYFGYFNKSKKSFEKTETSTPYYESRLEDDKRLKNFGSKSMTEYLLGSRQLKSFPVAMSLIASYISGVTVLGTPAEIYNYGTQYWLIIIAIFFQAFIVAFVYLPVFCSLKVGSSYEYLELRFNSNVRTFISIMFIIDELLFLPIIIYVPALAMNQVSGLSLHLIGAIVCVICVFYTLVGGIKAVVHTDAWQIIIMFVSVVIVVIIGTIYLEGPSIVLNRAIQGNRIKFLNFNPSLYERQTFWGVLIGGFFYWTSFNSVNQTMVQRYMSLPNIKKARLAIFIFTVGIILFISICCYAGLLIYAKYWKCDPLTNEMIKRDDQLFAIYVMETVGEWEGVAGLFIAGVFGAALSSLSVVLNSTAAVLLEDIVKGWLKINLNEKNSVIFVKLSIFCLGTLTLGSFFLVEKLGGILGVATALTAISSGTTFGIFSLGMLNPYCTSLGAIIGAVSGAILSGWISIGSQIAVASGKVIFPKLSVSIEDCSNLSFINTTMNNYSEQSDIFPLYKLSYHWINPIGVFTVVIVGSIVSYFTNTKSLRSIDPELFSPIIYRLFPNESFLNYGLTSKKKRARDDAELNIRNLNEDNLNDLQR